MKDLQTNRADKTVYIKADARARFASVTDVIDNLRTAGVDQLGLDYRKIQDKNKTEAGHLTGSVNVEFSGRRK